MKKSKRMAEGGASGRGALSPFDINKRAFQADIRPLQDARNAVLQDPNSTEAEIAEAKAAYRTAADPKFAAWHPEKTALKAAETLASRHARPTQGRAATMPVKMAKGGKVSAVKPKAAKKKTAKNPNW